MSICPILYSTLLYTILYYLDQDDSEEKAEEDADLNQSLHGSRGTSPPRREVEGGDPEDSRREGSGAEGQGARERRLITS